MTEIPIPVICPEDMSAQLLRGAGIAGIPEHMREGIIAYVRHGRPTGSFLQAIIRGDYFDACRRADIENAAQLFSYGVFLDRYAPAECFGNPTAYERWVKRGYDAREKARAGA